MLLLLCSYKLTALTAMFYLVLQYKHSPRGFSYACVLYTIHYSMHINIKALVWNWLLSDFWDVYGSIQSAAGMASSKVIATTAMGYCRKKQINIRAPLTVYETSFKSILNISIRVFFFFFSECASWMQGVALARSFIRKSDEELDQMRRKRARLTIHSCLKANICVLQL